MDGTRVQETLIAKGTVDVAYACTLTLERRDEPILGIVFPDETTVLVDGNTGWRGAGSMGATRTI